MAIDVTQHEAASITRYCEMVEALIPSSPTPTPFCKKIRDGQAVNAAEAAELAELLHAEHPHIIESLLQQVYKNHKASFIQFILHILGLSALKSFPDTVSETFEQFIQGHSNLSTRQLDFLSLLKGFILDREKVIKKDLISALFSVIHPQGIRGVFSPSEINEILQLTEQLVA